MTFRVTQRPIVELFNRQEMFKRSFFYTDGISVHEKKKYIKQNFELFYTYC